MARITDHLRKDHEKIKGLFEQYESNPASIFPELKALLDLHTKVEEEGVYPASVGFAQQEVDHAHKEHNEAKELLTELEKDPENMDVFDKLREGVTHHIEEEESDYFPLVEENMDEAKQLELDEIADQASGQ